MLVDLAIDSPPSDPPTVTMLGPTFAPLELGGRKLLALFGRAEARDFADIYVLAQRFGKDALIEHAAVLDRGFELDVLAQMMRALSRFADEEIPLLPDKLSACREFFDSWSTELDAPHIDDGRMQPTPCGSVPATSQGPPEAGEPPLSEDHRFLCLLHRLGLTPVG